MNGQNLAQVPHGWQSETRVFGPQLGLRTRPARTVAAIVRAALIGLGLLVAAECNKTSSSGPSPIPPVPQPTAPVLVGAGDIAGDLGQCPGAGAVATAALLDAISGMVFTSGDNVYGGATLQRYKDCYGPTWGRHLMRTRPVPGNHDYEMGTLAGYFQYFQGHEGPGGQGYYSYDYKGWHVVALNSIEDVRLGSPQLDWLENDLSSTSAPCTIAYWHHPLFSSGKNGNNFKMRDTWRVLYAHHVEIVLNGHDHWYERFAPQDPDGRVDNANGIRQFTVGTGGGDLYGLRALQPNSEVQGITWGVLKLSLESTSYAWEFIPVPGSPFHDTGHGLCH